MVTVKKNRFRVFAFLLALLSVLTLASCAKGDNVTKIGEIEFSRAFYEYLYRNFREEMRQNDPDFSEDETHIALIEEKVLASLKDAAAVETLARQYGIDVTDLAEETYEEMLATEYGGDEQAMKEALAEEGMDRELFLRLASVYLAEEALYDYLIDESNLEITVSDEMLEKDIRENFFHASQILILFANHTEEDANAIAEKILAKVKAGEDFGILIDQYGEDEEQKENPDAYYFTHGEFEIPEFEGTVSLLKEGETSGIVRSEIGLHIIRRLPLDENYIEAHFDELRIQCRTRKYYEKKDETASSLPVSFLPAFTRMQEERKAAVNAD